MSAKSRYSGFQILLHWLIAVLIAVNYFLGDAMSDVFRQFLRTGAGDLTAAAQAHRIVGISVVVLVLVRLVARYFQGAPEASDAGPDLLKLAAKIGHVLLYALMIITPVSGAIAFSFVNRTVGEIHEVSTNLLMLVALGHAVMALYHQYILKDQLLRRMM